MPIPKQISGRVGALESWANTPDRSARMAPAHRAGPGSIDYWLAKLDPERFAEATDEQRLAAADAARRAYFVRLSMRSAQSRARRKTDAQPA